MNVGDAITSEVDALQPRVVSEEPFGESLHVVPTQRDDAKAAETVKRAIRDLAYFIALELQLSEMSIGSESALANRHDAIVAQIHLLQLRQEATKKREKVVN